ncbi:MULTISPECIES: DUF2971 domain-containing protein [unclassified Flavobacterium]|uniref:DUF2971 domain-containing protein n=1 Tax=unclassified Flavobacterium TaxID=196869 RepID=UPI00131DAE55|nr:MULTISPECIES: DUF2971 domain-containing protein [unclassified Flavobacterium]
MKYRDEDPLEIQFLNDDLITSDMYLWRYLDLHKFLSFVSKKSLFFTRLDKFEDKREGITTKHLYFRRIKNVIENDPIFDSLREMITVDVLGSRMNIISKELETIQRFNFANCWLLSRDNFESAAMWSLYSNPNSVAIKIPYKNFKKLLLENGFDNDGFGRRIICSSVNYKDFQNTNHIFNPDQEEIEDSVFQKDVSFEHEKEFRMILREEPTDIPPIEYHENSNNEHMDKIHKSIYDYPGISLELKNFEKYPFQVVHHPKSQDWAKTNIEAIIKQFNIPFSISNSKLELK